jgi:hypothetical protein
MAFIDAPEIGGETLELFLPDLRPGYNLIRFTCNPGA